MGAHHVRPVLCTCAIRVHVVDGVAIKIEGEPESCQGASGGICGKGVSGLQVLYDPNRLNVPLKRTNPEKGLHVDPKWKEITWEEAYAEIVPRLKKILDENPNELFFQWTTSRADQYLFFGEQQFIMRICGRMPDVMGAGGGGLHCGKAAHSAAGVIYSSWSIVPDFKYCNYAYILRQQQRRRWRAFGHVYRQAIGRSPVAGHEDGIFRPDVQFLRRQGHGMGTHYTRH